MKWTVEKYVLREVVQTWLAVTGVLVAVLVSNQLSRVLGQAADNQYGRGVVFDLIALGTVHVSIGHCPGRVVAGHGVDLRPHVPRQ